MHLKQQEILQYGDQINNESIARLLLLGMIIL